MATSLAGDVSRWVDRIRSGDEDSTANLWDCYFDRLVGRARRRLADQRSDAEDVALSAFHSVCFGLNHGRFQELRHQNEIWALLLTVMRRKVRSHQRRLGTLKRGSGRALAPEPVEALAVDPASAEALALGNLLKREFLDTLPTESLRLVAEMRYENYQEREIAARLGCSVPTVKRKLAFVRTCLKKHLT